jgi:hypothetical protein
LLIFGVGTQADNTPPERTIPLLASPSSGYFNLLIGNNTTGMITIINSGTPFLFVNDPDANLPPVRSRPEPFVAKFSDADNTAANSRY